jgi:hypothetical protein
VTGTALATRWVVVCQRASVDEVFDDVTLFSCVPGWSSPEFPYDVGGLEVVAALYLRGDDPPELVHTTARWVCHPPGRTAVVLSEGALEVEATHGRARLTVAPFTFRTPGRYWFALDVLTDDGWVEVGRTPVDLLEQLAGVGDGR